MKTLVLSILLLFSPYREKYTCLEMDVIILVDISGSLAGYELYIHSAMNSFIDGIKLQEDGIKLGVVVFSSDSYVKSPLSSNKNSIRENIRNIGSDQRSTNMTEGLYVSLNELVSNGRQGVKKLIIVISDGAVDSDYGTKLAAEQLRMTNISICSVLILGETINRQLMKDISGGCYIESSYENLVKEIEKLDICI